MLKNICRYAFRHKKTTMIAAMLSMLAVSGFDYARGDTGTATATLTSSGILLAVYLTAGIEWSLSGFINNIRNHANFDRAHPGTTDPNWKGFEASKMRDDIFIGLILGTMAFLTSAATNVPVITTLGAFVAAVISAVGVISQTDKVVVGAILNR